MLSPTKLKRLFKDPISNAADLIQDQLERIEVQFDQHCSNNNPQSALALYQEYCEWIEAEEGDNMTFVSLERLFG